MLVNGRSSERQLFQFGIDGSNASVDDAEMSTKPSTTYKPKYLGHASREAIETVDCIPWQGGPISVCLACSEFTSLCPITGQPDFGEIIVRYTPRDFIIETKSMKLFLMNYRDRGVFNEALVDEMADALYRQIKPHQIEITGRFHSRGGIAITVTAQRPDGEFHGNKTDG